MPALLRLLRTILTLCAMAGLLIVVPATVATATPTAEGEFVSRLNAARAAAGLPPLAVAGDLTENARMHSRWMASTGTLAHNPNLATQISGWTSLGENVGYGSSVLSVHNALMNSAGHRANILSSTFNQVGVGVTIAPTGRVWVTQVFRKSATALPVGSPIDQRHAALGGSGGVLGQPTSAELPLPDGRFRHYQGGSIYTSVATPAVEVRGAIRTAWSRLGWERSALRYPRTGELPTPDGRGRFNHFQTGSIYWTPTTGAQEVRGSIQQTWARLGWERSALGYPKTSERGTPDGLGRFNHFERGSIYWTSRTGAREVRGAIRDTWARLGWERSGLGYPTTNELATPDRVGRFNHFQAGSVYWTPRTGAKEVRGAIRAHWASMGWERSRLGYPVSDEYAVPGGRRTDFQGGSIFWNSATRATTVL